MNAHNTVPPLPERINAILGVSMVCVHGFSLLLLPMMAHIFSVAWLWVLVPVALLANTHWSLIHEAIHKHFSAERSSNNLWGRALSVCFGVSFYGVQFPHLMHHRYNRNWESEYLEQHQNWLTQTLNHYIYILGGLYWFEVFGSLLASILPAARAQKLIADLKYPRHSAEHKTLWQQTSRFYERDNRSTKVRLDGIAIALLYSAAFILYGSLGWALLMMLITRGVLVSLADNAYHYGTPVDNSVSGKELYVPRWLSVMWLHFNYHHTHHEHVGAPWTQLPALSRGYDTNTGFLRATLQQFKGVKRRGEVPSGKNRSDLPDPAQ